MPAFSVKGQFYVDELTKDCDRLLEDPSLEQSNDQASSFYVYTHGIFYYYHFIDESKRWLRAYLKQDWGTKVYNLVWQEIIFHSIRAFAMPLATSEIVDLQSLLGDQQLILNNLKDQRRQFQAIQTREEAESKLIQSVIEGPKNTGQELYEGRLTISQQTFLRMSIELDSDIPEVKTEAYQAMIQLALDTDLKIEKPSGLEKFSQSIQEEFGSIRRYLHPYFINMQQFREPQEQWPTIGEVQDYLIWLLKGKRQDLKLDPTIAATTVGKLKQDKQFLSLNIPENQHFLMHQILHAVQSSADLSKFAVMKDWSLEELWLIKDQFTGAINASGIESSLADDLVLIFPSIGLYPYSDVYKIFKDALVQSCTRRIEELEEELEAYLRDDSVIFDIGLIRSLPQEQVIPYGRRLQPLGGNEISAMLSVLPTEKWSTLCKELDFTVYQTEGTLLELYLELLVKIPERNWPALSALPSVLVGIDKRSMQPGYFVELMMNIPPQTRYALCLDSPISKALPLLVRTAYEYTSLVDILTHDDALNLMHSPPMIEALYGLQPLGKRELARLLPTLGRHFSDSQFMRFMKSNFFKIHVLEKKRLFILSDYIKKERVRQYLNDPEINANLAQWINNSVDLSVIHNVFDQNELLALYTREDIAAKIRSLPVSAFLVYGRLRGFDPSYRSVLRKCFNWENQPLKFIGQVNKLIDMRNGIDAALALDRRNFSEELSIARRDERMFASVAQIFVQDKNGIIFKHANEFGNELDVIKFISHLPIDQFPRFLSLPGMAEKLQFTDMPEGLIQCIDSIFYEYSPEGLHALLMQPLILAKMGELLTYFSIRIFYALKERLTEFLDTPSLQETLDRFWNDSGKSATLWHLGGYLIPGNILNTLAFFRSRFIQRQVPDLLASIDSFILLLHGIRPEDAWTLIADNHAILQRYIYFISMDQGAQIFAQLESFKGTPDQERRVLEATREAYHQYDQKNTQTLLVKRFWFFDPLPKPERPFLDKLEERVVSSKAPRPI